MNIILLQQERDKLKSVIKDVIYRIEQEQKIVLEIDLDSCIYYIRSNLTESIYTMINRPYDLEVNRTIETHIIDYFKLSGYEILD